MAVLEVQVGNVTLDINLNDSETATQLLSHLPIRARIKRWGGQVYFPLALNTSAANDAQEHVDIGDVVYWPPSQSLCLFFGSTPCSQDSNPSLPSAGNKIGELQGDLTGLSNLGDNYQIDVRLKSA